MISRPRFLRIAWLLVLVLLLGTFANVLAAASGPVDTDISVSAAGGSNGYGGDANIVRVNSTNFAACAPAIAGVFSRNISNPSSSNAVELATLTLTVANVSANNKYPLTLSLFATTADISESPVTTTPLADLISGTGLNSAVTLNAAPAIGSNITFPTSDAFVDAANAALTGDGRLTVLVEITSCPATSVEIVDFASHESGTAPQFYFEGPLGVTLSTFSADDRSAVWPLYAGLGAVALILVAGLAISRRRTA